MATAATTRSTLIRRERSRAIRGGRANCGRGPSGSTGLFPAVAGADHRLDRIEGRIDGLELATESANIGIHDPIDDDRAVAPDHLQQALAREDDARAPRQGFEEAKLGHG